VVSAAELIDQHGADVIRYLLLATHYRSPIEFTDQVMSDTKKAYAVFTRLFERVERLTKQPISDIRPTPAQLGDFATFRPLFEARMDDDFNTAGAIAEMHQLAGQINAFIESRKLEQGGSPADLATISAGAAELKNLGQILGLFRVKDQPAGASSKLVDDL